MQSINKLLYVVAFVFMASGAIAHDGGGGTTSDEYADSDERFDDGPKETLEQQVDRVIQPSIKTVAKTEIKTTAPATAETPNGIFIDGIGYIAFAHKMDAMTPDEKQVLTKVLGIDGNSAVQNDSLTLNKIEKTNEQSALQKWKTQ